MSLCGSKCFGGRLGCVVMIEAGYLEMRGYAGRAVSELFGGEE